MWINTRRDVERPVSSVPLPQTLAPAMLWAIFSLEGTLRDAAAGGGAASPFPPAEATPQRDMTALQHSTVNKQPQSPSATTKHSPHQTPTTNHPQSLKPTSHCPHQQLITNSPNHYQSVPTGHHQPQFPPATVPTSYSPQHPPRSPHNPPDTLHTIHQQTKALHHPPYTVTITQHPHFSSYSNT